jgi:splicing factor 3B subunit 3
MVVSDLIGEMTNKQIYLACGKSNKGSIRQLSYGLTVIEMATSPMPLKPIKVITIKHDSMYDKYVIVSFIDSSLILGINDGKISSVHDSGF